MTSTCTPLGSGLCIFTYLFYLHNYLHNYHNEICTRPNASWYLNLQWTRSWWAGVDCSHMHVYIHYPHSLLLCSAPLAHHLLSRCFVFFLSSLCPHAHLTSHRTSMKGAGCITTVHVCVCVCVCMCVWPTVPLLKAPHTIRTSLSDLPHLLSRQVVSTPGEELSFSLCLSVTLNLSPLRLFLTPTHTHARTHTHAYNPHACAHTPLCQDSGCLLLRHLPECRLSDISHPGCNRWWWGARSMTSVLSSRTRRAFGLTLLWCLNPLQKSKFMLTGYSSLYFLLQVRLLHFILAPEVKSSACFCNRLQPDLIFFFFFLCDISAETFQQLT